MVNELTSIRTDVATTLEAVGIKAVEYARENVVPPVCVVVPGTPYVQLEEGNRFGMYTVSITVLIIAGKGTNKASATAVDSMIIEVVNALDDDWDITEVTAPQEMSIGNTTYLGAVVALETNTKLQGGH